MRHLTKMFFALGLRKSSLGANIIVSQVGSCDAKANFSAAFEQDWKDFEEFEISINLVAARFGIWYLRAT